MDVHVEGMHPFLVGNLVEAVAHLLEGGVVDQHVDAAKGFDGFLHHVQAGLAVDQVAGQQDGLAPGLGDQAGGLAGILVLVQVGDGNIGAFTGEGDGHGAADTAVGAGNQRRLALEATRAAIGVGAAVGQRIHARFGAGKGLGLGFQRGLGIVAHGDSLKVSELAVQEEHSIPRSAMTAGP